MNKLSKFICFSMMGFWGATIANAEIIQTEKHTIYTEDFVVSSDNTNNKSSVSTNSEDSSQILGRVGSLAIKSGQRTKDYVAFVKTNNRFRNYLIGSNIWVECEPNVICIPDSYHAQKIGKTDLYKVTVENYQEWQNYMRELEVLPSVVTIAPSYHYGIKKSLR